LKFPGSWRAALVAVCLAASSCQEAQSPPPPPEPIALAVLRQEARSTRKVLILGSSVSGGAASREAQAAAQLDYAVDVVTPAQWSAMTAEQFMSYRALVIGDAACQQDQSAFQAAIGNRHLWGHIVDGNVVLIGADPSTNNTPLLVENAIEFARARPMLTGLYIALGCAYQNAPPGTAVTLLEPFGTFQAAGVGCAGTGHLFEMFPDTLSASLWDELLSGDGCVARSVFTTYPERTFAFASLAMGSAGSPVPGEKSYLDYTFGEPISFVGTPYILVRGAMARGAGCGLVDEPPGEECDLGDMLNGHPAVQGEPASATCSWSCRAHWCGDGVVDAQFGEQCDSGFLNGRSRDSSGSIGLCSSFCGLLPPPPANHPPEAHCKNVRATAETTCGVAASIDDGSFDPDGDLLGCEQSPAGPYGIGTTVVTLTCTDAQGNSSSCTGTVRVTDSVVPSLSLTGPASLRVECGTAYSDEGATASDLCEGDLTGAIIQSGTVNPQAPGHYTMHYSVTDSAGNSPAAVSRAIRVSDTMPPALTLRGLPVEHLECGAAYVSLGAIAVDQCAGDLEGSIEQHGAVNPARPDSYSLTYKVKDPAGHSAQPVHRAVSVADTLSPEVTLQGPVEAVAECGVGTYRDPGATAEDLCARALPALPSTTVSLSQPGLFTIHYSATDPSGNRGTARTARTVTVRDSLPPELTLDGPAHLTVECGAAYQELGATAWDACAGDLRQAVRMDEQIDSLRVGTHTLRYSVTDPSGNSASPVQRTVTVADTQPPHISCPPPVTLQALEGELAPHIPAAAETEDACDPAVRVSRPAQTRFAAGTTELMYTATDAAGNSASCTSVITVLAIALPDTWILSGPPEATEETSATFAFGASKPQVTYECSVDGSPHFTDCQDISTFTQLSEGGHGLLVRARDNLGNVDPTPAGARWTVVAPATPWDRALLGSGNGCASAGSAPSSLAWLGLALLRALSSRGRRATRASPGGYGARVRLLAVAVMLLATSASAQPEGIPTFELERLSLNPSGTGSLLLGTGELLPAKDYRLALTSHYENEPLVLVTNGVRLGTVVRHRTTAHLSAAYGLGDRLELGLQVPLLLQQRGDDLTGRGVPKPLGGTALGTPLALLRLKLLAQRDGHPVDLSVGAQAGPRLGSAAALARELRATPSLMVGRGFGPVRAALDLGMLLRSRTVLSQDARVQDEVGHALRLGAALATTGRGVRAETAFIASVPLRREGYSVEALAGLRLPMSAASEAYAMAGLGYGNAPGTPDFRLLLGVAYDRPALSSGADNRDTPPTVPMLEAQALDGQAPPEVERESPPPEEEPEREEYAIAEPAMDSSQELQGDCPDLPDADGIRGCPTDGGELASIMQNRIELKHSLYFDFGKATLQARSFPLLDQVANLVAHHPEIFTLGIEGHTDDRGSLEYNRGLSLRRAGTVRDYLVKKGIEPDRLEARGFGEERPIQTNLTQEGRTANRRVEFVIEPPSDEP
jgi:outer membrane protein OmpA-like peptidoglycan-associated protein